MSIVTTPSDGVIVSPEDNALSLSDRLDETAIATLGRLNFGGTSLRISTSFPSSAPALPCQPKVEMSPSLQNRDVPCWRPGRG